MISDETFPKEEHLIKTKDFRKVYKEGSLFKKNSIFLYRLMNNSARKRAGFVVSARSVKLATRRNRIKRLLREVYRKTKKEIKSGVDIIIVVKKEFSTGTAYKDVEAVFLELTKKAGIRT